MTDQVVKPFKTVNRRFAVGDVVTAADIQGVVSFEQWKENGFIGAPEVKAAPVDKWVPAAPKDADAS